MLFRSLDPLLEEVGELLPKDEAFRTEVRERHRERLQGKVALYPMSRRSTSGCCRGNAA